MDLVLHVLAVLSIFGIILQLAVTKDIKRHVNIRRYICNKANYDILHVKAKMLSSNDIIHYLWTTIDMPTIVTAHTKDPNVKPVIMWNNCSNLKITFQPKVSSMSSFVLTNVFEYEDKDDDQDATKNVLRNVMDNFAFELKSISNGSDGSANAMFEGKWNSSTIGIQLKAFAVNDYDDELPHERISENCTRFTFSLDGLPVKGKNSRYAVEVAFLKAKGSGKPSFKTSKSIDDEYTPGIFKIWEVNIPVRQEQKMFASWKPVAYNNKERKHDTQTFSHNYPKTEDGFLTVNKTAPKTIMNSLIGDNIEAYTMTVSFGQNKDEFYQKTKFTSWTGIVGYGQAPASTISTKVYLILSIGLGLPIVISLFGSLFLLVRKANCGKRAVYEQIN